MLRAVQSQEFTRCPHATNPNQLDQGMEGLKPVYASTHTCKWACLMFSEHATSVGGMQLSFGADSNLRKRYITAVEVQFRR